MLKFFFKKEKPQHDIMKQGTSNDIVQFIYVGCTMWSMQPALQRSLLPQFSVDPSCDRNTGESKRPGH